MNDFREDEQECDRNCSCFCCGADIRDGNEFLDDDGKTFCSDRCRSSYHEDSY